MRIFRLRFVVFGITILLTAAFATHGQENCTDQKIFSAANCIGDIVSTEEKALFDLVNKFRVENSLQPIKLSSALSLLGNRRILDLTQNMKTLTHSWSNCPYEISDEKTWPCLLDSPTRLQTGYIGQGYETLYRTSQQRVVPAAALDAWRKSALHSSIILNKGLFADMAWDELGVAIDRNFAVLWFGHLQNKVSVIGYSGLGVSFEKATAGLSKSLSIKETSSTGGITTWRGVSPDGKVHLDIAGRNANISEAEITVSVKIVPGHAIEPAKRSVMLELLRNIFPEWTDADSWLDLSLRQIGENRTAWRRKAVRGIPTEMLAEGADGVKLRINAAKKSAPVEMD